METCWTLLKRAPGRRRDPLRIAAVGTGSGSDCHLRAMILREVAIEERGLFFFTDWRSPKIGQLIDYPVMSCLFYHPVRQMQIRARGRVRLFHQDEVAEKYWREIPAAGRKDYAGIQAPGTRTSKAWDGIPDFWKGAVIREGTEVVYANFAVICCQLGYLECLVLHPGGHQRAGFEWSHGQWHGNWLIP